MAFPCWFRFFVLKNYHDNKEMIEKSQTTSQIGCRGAWFCAAKGVQVSPVKLEFID